MNTDTIPMDELLRHRAWLLRLAKHLTRDEAAAEDLVQETWVASIERPPPRDRSPRSWLAHVLKNFWRRRHRGDSRRMARELRAVTVENEASVTTVVERAEVQRVVANLVLDLDEPVRTTMLLCYFDGLSSVEIARRTGSPEGTVRWHLKSGRDKVRAGLDRRFGERSHWSALVAVAGRGGGRVSAKVVAAVAVVGLASVMTWTAFRAGESPPGELAVGPVPSPAVAGALEEVIVEEPTEPQVALAPTSEPAPEDEAPSPGVELRVRVVDLERAPLAGATARVVGHPAPVASADGDGRIVWSASALASSPYRVEFRAPGRVSTRRTVTATSGVVQLGAVALGPGGTVAGVVVDDEGEPVSGATVTYGPGTDWTMWPADVDPTLTFVTRDENARLHQDGFARSVETDEDGRFAIEGLPPGNRRIVAKASASRFTPSAPFVVRGGEVTRDVEVELAPMTVANAVRVSVVDAEGRPVEGARLDQTWAPAPGPVAHRSDARGELLVPRPLGASGPFALYAYRPGLAVGAGRVEVEPDDEAVTLVLPHSAPLAISLRGEGASAVDRLRVDLGAEDGEYVVFGLDVTRDEDGSFRVPSAPVPFRLFLLSDGRTPTVVGPLAAGTTEVEVEMPPTPSRRVIVVTPDGAPLVGACVERVLVTPAERDDRGFRSRGALVGTPQKTAEDGAFRVPEQDGPGFGAAPSERYDIVAPGVGVGRLDRDDVEGDAATSLVVRPGGVVVVTVRADGERPAVGVPIGLHDEFATLRSARTDRAGHVRFDDLAPGAWQVAELADEPWRDVLSLGLSPSKGFSLVVGPIRSVEVETGETASVALRAVSARSVRVSGRVRLGGELVDAGRASLSRPGEDAVVDAASIVEGEFALLGDGPGEWTLRLQLLAIAGVMEVPVSLASGRPHLELEFPMGSISGRAPAWAGKSLELVVRLTGGGTWRRRVPIEADGRFELSSVPVGAGQLLPTGGGGEEPVERLAEFDVRSGEAVRVVLDAR